MDGDQIARVLYLVLLGAAVGGYVLIGGRERLGQTARHAALWGLIFVGTVAAIGLWNDVRDDVAPRQSFVDGRVEVPRGPGGHYDVTLEVEGEPVRFVVDTGATDVVLSRADAERVGVDLGALAYTGRAETANGTVRVAEVVLDEVRLGGIVDRDVRASVTEGELFASLLGMRYLERFERISIEDGRLILER
jgi:aspartyl protease family protein